MKIKHLLIFPLIAALFSCAKEDFGNDVQVSDNRQKIYMGNNFPEEWILNGRVTVKLKEEAASRVATETRSGGLHTGMAQFDAAVAEIKTNKITRAFKFENNDRFEARKRKAGLHLWFDITFDESMPVSEAAKILSEVGEIEYIEPSIKYKLNDYNVLEVISGAELTNMTPTASPSGFDDPNLPKQWHYYNDGSVPNSVVGADINLFDAWKVETGKPEVIVCIVDGGVDYAHEDLAQNMWLNEAEVNGVSGVDDDNNGYVDDIYGYNFVADSGGNVTPDDHGTHVAGTVAAVNNNNKGVAGVAGGNGSSTSGVRIMSAQVFSGDNGASDEGFRNALMYGADNGAVISQNSWGSEATVLPQSLKAGIDYFIDNAGKDEYGNQLPGSPMKGGIVIFAAGNAEQGKPASNRPIMPSSYERVFTVSSMAPNFIKASYSHYGDWVEITAPGGELTSNSTTDPSGIWSTYPGNRYGVMQGTSMACPHVSGVAALAVSLYGAGKPGFTNTQLWDILSAAVRDDVDINAKNPTFAYELGAGYMDASKALGADVAPAPVTDLSAAWHYNTVDLSWSATYAGAQEANSYEILISENDLTGADFNNPPANATKKTIRRENISPIGGVITTTIDELQPGTGYYISIIAVSRGEKKSTAAMINGTTTTTPEPNPVTDLAAIWGLDNVSLKWSVTGDANNVKAVSYVVLLSERALTNADFANTPQDVLKKNIEVGSKNIGDALTETFEQLKQNTTYYVAVAGLNSAGDRSSMAIISGKTQNDLPPSLIEYIQDQYFPALGHQVTINLSEYFDDELDAVLAYDITATPASMVKIEEAGDNTYTFTSLEYGLTDISVTASDSMGQTITDEFAIMCRDDSKPMDLYPNPVKDNMYIRLGKDVKGNAEVAMYNSGGEKVLSKSFGITTYSPGMVDVSKLSADNYTVVVTYHGKETKGSITKY